MSQIISIASSIQPQVYLDASIPYFNGVFLLHGDSLEAGISGVYFGDEVNLLFWEQLDIKMISSNTYSYTYPLLSGYRYIYNTDGRRFIIYDDNGAVVFENTIVGLNDFCINFDVYKSHQFEIHVSAFGDSFSFYKVARLYRTLNNSTLNYNAIGFDNIVASDRIRPYGKYDEDNPSWDIHNLGSLDNAPVDKCVYDFSFVNNISSLFGIILSSIRSDKVVASNNFYAGLSDFAIDGELISYKIGASLLSLDMLLPNLVKTMYPALTGTNYVLYGPWLIWGIYQLLYSKRIIDIEGDDFEVFPFDLSPLWG